MILRSRRDVLRCTGALLVGTLAAGCAGRLQSDDGDTGPPLKAWVPAPNPVNGKDHYLTSDVVFWDFANVRQFEDELHPAFYDQITQTKAVERLGVSPADVETRIDVASQSATVYRGRFDPAEVESALVDQDGFTVGETIGEFSVLIPDDSGYQNVVGVGEDAVIVADGASIEMANDDRSSRIEPRTVLSETIDARRGDGRAYADERDEFSTLAEAVRGFSTGLVKTFHPVEKTERGSLQVAGTTGIAHGARLGRPESEYAFVLAFEDADAVSVDPAEEFVAQHPGMSEYDDVSYSVDGATLTVSAHMENDRFDGYLSGDPSDWG